jgi:cardiolipin synthase
VTAAESSTVRAAQDRLLTLSNILSITRALLAVPFAVVMLSRSPSSRWWGAAIMVLAALTDKLDGVFARKYGQITEWGKILDPLADKIAVAVVVVVLLALDEIPMWFVIVVLLRDLLIFAGGMYVKASRGVVLQSNEAGKWTVGIIALTLFLLVVGLHSVVTDVLIGVSVAMLAVSFAMYVQRFLAVMKEAHGVS